METVMPPTDGAHSVVETTDSVTALYGSDSDHLSEFEDLMDTSIPHDEYSPPSISAFEGIGSWTENIPNRADYLLLQPQLLVLTNSREAKAVIRGNNRTDAVARMPDEAENEPPLVIPSKLGPRRQLLDTISDAESPNQRHTSLFFPEANGGPVIQTWKGGVVARGDIENQRNPDRSMKKLPNKKNHVLQFVLLISATCLSMILSYLFWTC